MKLPLIHLLRFTCILETEIDTGLDRVWMSIAPSGIAVGLNPSNGLSANQHVSMGTGHRPRDITVVLMRPEGSQYGDSDWKGEIEIAMGRVWIGLRGSANERSQDLGTRWDRGARAQQSNQKSKDFEMHSFRRVLLNT
jgi:hypothetical protein